MPYGPKRQTHKQVQAEQERTLRRVLGDDLYDWLESFEGDLDVLNLEK